MHFLIRAEKYRPSFFNKRMEFEFLRIKSTLNHLLTNKILKNIFKNIFKKFKFDNLAISEGIQKKYIFKTKTMVVNLYSIIITKANSKWTKGEKVIKNTIQEVGKDYYEKDDKNCKLICLINSMLQKIQDTNPTNL